MNVYINDDEEYLHYILFDNILLLKALMNKSTKKDKLQLRFDTSTDKLACFIKKKPKPIEPETSEKRGRKKIKSYKERALQFQNDAFLENILSNILSEEFTGGEEIKKLMQDCELADQAEIH